MHSEPEVRLALDSQEHKLVLSPHKFDAAGVFIESYLEFFLVNNPDRSWVVPILAQVELCQVQSANFARNKLQVTHFLG